MSITSLPHVSAGAATDRRRVLSQAVIRAADRLDLKAGQLAKIIGVSPTSVSRMRAGTFTLDPSTKSWELAALLVRLFRGLDAITGGDDDSARAWLRNRNVHLNGVPVERIQKVLGLVETVTYVDAWRAVV